MFFDTFKPSGRATAVAWAASSGVLYIMGFCGFGQFYLAWMCLVPILWVFDNPHLTSRDALLLGWLMGLVTHLGGYRFIIGMLQEFAYLPLPLAFLGYLLLCGVQSSLFGVWGLGVHRLVHRWGQPITLAAPVALVGVEWLYPALFPVYLANSQYRQRWVIQSLDIGGPLYLSFVLALSSAALYRLLAWGLRRQGAFPMRTVGITLGLVGITLGYGAYATHTWDARLAHAPGRMKVGIAQINMGAHQKALEPLEGLRRQQEQSLQLQNHGAQLIVWPESGYLLHPILKDTSNVRDSVMGPLHTPLIFGGIRVEEHARQRLFFNTAFLADADGRLLGHYDKIHLLAFGEYLPGGELFPWLYSLSPHTTPFTKGQTTAPLRLKGMRYGVMVCYEDILPSFVRTLMQHRADILVNLTNDVWFGRSQEPYIHLALSSFRAVEQRRYMIRATNTGVSAIVDPTGRMVIQSPLFERTNLLGSVVPLQTETFYQRWGNWPGIGALAWILYSGIRHGTKQRRSKAHPS